ncbi:MAG: aminopeptidase N [Gammaproteobacteria bacterium]|nr:aminopeptidase N [Gammaproteobacteria bacterium]MDH3766927.1 aminopeptidase N [Gammaproteobacteria bacterium]
MPRIKQPILTADQAHYRSELVSDVRYHIDMSLSADSDDYTGTVVVEFQLADVQPLTLDFKGGTVYSVEINGVDSEFYYDGAWIELDIGQLEAGLNKVLVHYSHPYSKDGAGLQRTRDTEDQRVYVYTHFEPYDANRLFPCFDQPDLKARYKLSVSAPAHWEVVSAAQASTVTMLSPGIRDWEFAETRPFSTYLFSLHAGPYTIWEAQAGSIPLRLLARPTLAAYVDADYWFELTRNGFAFYENLFDIAYPFDKYDQVIVPDLNIGAMENVAAVTYNELYVTRAARTIEQKQRHAEVLLHEMAHMWFGDLVTPKWWDGLWLKEAVATHVSFIAMQATTSLENPAQRFFAGAKQMGYRADERESRHPIDVPVEDTHVAFANFDAITYEKGSSALTQLSHFVGPEAFRAGLRRYLKKNAWGNTTLEDFIGALEGTSGMDLREWMHSWLRSAGVNTILPNLICADGRVSALTLQQTAPGGVPLRAHRIQVALFDAEGDASVFPVSIEGGSSKVTEVTGLPCPAMTLVNHDDWSFARTELDPLTLKNFYTHIGNIRDPLARAMFWQSLWEMVRNANFPLTAYIDLITQHAVTETDNLLLIQLTRAMQASQNYLLRSAGPRDASAARSIQKLEQSAWEALNAAPSGGERQKTWLKSFVALASTPEYLQQLEAFLEGHRIPRGIEIDADTRWDILSRLNAFAFGDFESRADMEALRDKSDRGRKRAIEVTATRPDSSIKQIWIDGVLDKPDFMPLGQLRYGMRALFPSHQLELLEPFSDRLLSALQLLGRTRDDAFLREFSRLIPATCTNKSITRLEHAISSGSFHPILERGLRNALEEDRRCLAIGKLAMAPTS